MTLARLLTAFGEGFAEGLGLWVAVALACLIYFTAAKAFTKGRRR